MNGIRRKVLIGVFEDVGSLADVKILDLMRNIDDADIAVRLQCSCFQDCSVVVADAQVGGECENVFFVQNSECQKLL